MDNRAEFRLGKRIFLGILENLGSKIDPWDLSKKTRASGLNGHGKRGRIVRERREMSKFFGSLRMLFIGGSEKPRTRGVRSYAACTRTSGMTEASTASASDGMVGRMGRRVGRAGRTGRPDLKTKEKEGQVSKVSTPKKRKSEKGTPSQPQKKKEPARSIPPSPPPILIPISINPIPPFITSKATTTIPIPTPIFSEATTVTITQTIKPEVHANVSDTGVRTSVVATPVISKPLSPTPSIEIAPVLRGEKVELDSFYYSPYRVQIDDDDDAPITKQHLKELNEKIHKLTAS
uniref:Uncharacterized protein n=1 Tax=Lactuca sativa TaxID=4236 RepID=A0A9R1W6R8_LACSA|nr:hypothetical protein LSAT_V11C300101750 [Lactuca sativa]